MNTVNLKGRFRVFPAKAKFGDDTAIINYAKRQRKKHRWRLVFSRCRVVNKSHL